MDIATDVIMRWNLEEAMIFLFVVVVNLLAANLNPLPMVSFFQGITSTIAAPCMPTMSANVVGFAFLAAVAVAIVFHEHSS